jgi:cytochrome c2
MLPLEYVQASCNKCHNVMEAPIPGADHLNAGWQLVQEKGCKTCHYIVDSGAKQAPELSVVGTKFYNESGYSEAFHGVRFGYLKESLRCPQANMSHDEAKQCKADLAPATAAPAGAALSAADLITKYQCTNCHSLDTPNKILGPSLYDIGGRQNEAYIRESLVEPDKVVVAGFPAGVMKGTLSGVGFYKDIQQDPTIVETLVKHLAGLKGGTEAGGAAPAAATVVMPNFNLSDEELRNVVVFLLGLQEPTVPWPQKSFATAADGGQKASAGLQFAGKSGEDVVKLAGCATCHKLDGPERLVGPSLWDIGARQSKEYIRDSILEPDKVLTPGYPGGVMGATLTGLGFYQNLSVEGLEKLVDYLAGLQGK